MSVCGFPDGHSVLESRESAVYNLRVLDVSGTKILNEDLEGVIRDCSTLVELHFRAGRNDQSRTNCFEGIRERNRSGTYHYIDRRDRAWRGSFLLDAGGCFRVANTNSASIQDGP